MHAIDLAQQETENSLRYFCVCVLVCVSAAEPGQQHNTNKCACAPYIARCVGPIFRSVSQTITTTGSGAPEGLK